MLPAGPSASIAGASQASNAAPEIRPEIRSPEIRSSWQSSPSAFAAWVSRFLGIFVAAAIAAAAPGLAPAPASAEPACDGPELRVCSENLERWGDPGTKGGEPHRAQQLAFLVERMRSAECDVVALQEVFGHTAREAQRTVRELAAALSAAAGENFEGSIAASEDAFIRNGYLLRSSKFLAVKERSYLDEPLPRLARYGPIVRYSRAPAGIILRLRTDRALPVFILNIHFKSKHDSFKDRSGTEFETMRMVMAEGAREILLREVRKGDRDLVPILLGDRNAGETSATAELLAGRRQLAEFISGTCALSRDEDHVPECRSGPGTDQLVPLLHTARRDGTVGGGSFAYRGKHELLDEIFILPRDLPRVRDPHGRLRVGLTGRFLEGSDHKMPWVGICLKP